MATRMTDAQMQTITIRFPKVDFNRLKGIAKAMGWTIEKSCDYYDSPQFYRDIDKAEKEIAAGGGKKISSVEELDALLS